MTSKHTPGPWTVQQDGTSLYIVANLHGDGVTMPAGEFTLAHLRIGFGVTGRGAEALQNARLIAAAPELLDMVRRLTAVAELYKRQHSGDIVHAADEARALLARIDR